MRLCRKCSPYKVRLKDSPIYDFQRPNPYSLKPKPLFENGNHYPLIEKYLPWLENALNCLTGGEKTPFEKRPAYLQIVTIRIFPNKPAFNSNIASTNEIRS